MRLFSRAPKEKKNIFTHCPLVKFSNTKSITCQYCLTNKLQKKSAVRKSVVSSSSLKNLLHDLVKQRLIYRIKVDICEESLNESSNMNPERVQTQDVCHFTVKTKILEQM